MYARVWKLVILPGKVEEFAVVINSMMPTIDGRPGSAACSCCEVARRKAGSDRSSAWESLVALRNSENSAFEQLLARILPFVNIIRPCAKRK